MSWTSAGSTRPTVVGSRWVRREPAGDYWDGPVEVCGLFDLGNDSGGLELCVRTVDFTGEPVVTAACEEFVKAYKRVTEDDPAAQITARLAQIEATA